MCKTGIYKPPEDTGGLCQCSPYLNVHRFGSYKTKHYRLRIKGENKQVFVNITDQRYHSDGHSSKSVYQVQQSMILEPGKAVAISHLSGFLYALLSLQLVRLSIVLKGT